MQINFFATKSNIIKLFTWISENVEDVVFLDFYTKKEFSLEELQHGEVGYGEQILISTRQFAENFKEWTFKEAHINCVELYFTYSDEEIYTSDYSGYNPYRDSVKRPIHTCRVYRMGFYNDRDESKTLIPIYKKITGKIKRHSVYKNWGYLCGYLLNFNNK